MENVRISAELLANNQYKISRGEPSVTVENYYDDMRPLTIKLDVTKTPAQNVQHLFNKYNKLKRAKEISREQIEEYSKELDYVNSILDALSRAELSDAENIKDELVALKIIKKQGGNGRKKVVQKSAPKTYEKDGFTIYVGTNNMLNNEVTFKIGRSYDVWLHVKNHHGSHVIIRKTAKMTSFQTRFCHLLRKPLHTFQRRRTPKTSRLTTPNAATSAASKTPGSAW